MFVLRVLSDDSLRGRETDDGFTIGAFTGETLFLVVVTAFLGTVGGLVYLGLREWLPPNRRAGLFGLLCGAVGGTFVIRPDGVDFTVLRPLFLAVGMFVALPAAYGVSLSLITERLVRSLGSRPNRRSWLPLLGLGPLILGGPFGVAAVVVLALIIGINRSGVVVHIWRSRPLTALGRGAYAATLAGGAILLGRDIVAVL